MLENKQYVPLLRTGLAEIGAYRSLFPDVKASIFPIFLARPWPNAKNLSLTVERVSDAANGEAFGLGLDRARFRHTSPLPAQSQFDQLFDQRRGYEAYYEFLEQIPSAVLVLFPTASADNLLLQIGNADNLDRGLIIHQSRGSQTPLSEAILGLDPLPHDTIIVIDAGWSRDYLQLESWTIPLVTRVHSALPNAEVVVMSSSFPDSFAHIVGNGQESVIERRLEAVVRQRFNRLDLTYGDWGSTRPQLAGGGGSIPSRVDIPCVDKWEIFRADPDNDSGFAEMAWDAQHHPCFADTPDCWGKQIIAATNDQGEGITGTRIAAESRINIHMTIQSGAESIMRTDEAPYHD